jgi:ssDNA-binding Zn-finger/Zn-ribbon topoisomerase 1
MDAPTPGAPRCPKCGAEMVYANTLRFRFGEGYSRRWWNCPRYPQCRSARAARRVNGKA